jgi:hypothetical protein
MPKFVTAVNAGQKLVRTSIQHIKTALKEYPGTVWEIAVYNQKFDLPNFCKMLEDMDGVKAEEKYSLKVTEGGTCRKA